MTDSLTDRFRELQQARSLSDPRIEAMIADVRLIRTEVRGLSVSGNLALGNSRAAVEDVESLKAEITLLKAELARMDETIVKVREWLAKQVKT